MSIIIAVDLGLTGAIARVGTGLPPLVRDLTVVPDGGPRESGKTGKVYHPRRLCGRALLNDLREFCPAGYTCTVVFEDVIARPNGNKAGQGNTIFSQGSLLQSKGLLQGAIDIAGFALHPVTPQEWQKFFGLISHDKAAGRQKAQALFPSLVSELNLVKHHNRSDALLMAHWGLRKLA